MFLELAQCCKHDRSVGLSGDAVHTRPHEFFPRIPEGFHDESATAPGGGSELGVTPRSSSSWEETAKTFSPTDSLSIYRMC